MERDSEFKMSVSPVCEKNGSRIAYVSFTDDKRSAEGEIPRCKITKSYGFVEEEVAQLEIYMKQNLSSLKKMAANVNVMKAFMGQ